MTVPHPPSTRIRCRKVILRSLWQQRGLSTKMPDTDGEDRSTSYSRNIVRLMLQALRENGYAETAATLQLESGITMEIPTVASFRSAIIEGRYDEAIQILPRVLCAEGEEDSFLSSTLSVAATTRYIIFEIEKERYLELLEKRHVKEAAGVLRESITPNAENNDKVHSLARLLVYGGRVLTLRQMVNWDGTGIVSRERLLQRIQELLPRNLMMPPRRLEKLIEQALAYQAINCVGHFDIKRENPSLTDGLFSDHQCPPSASNLVPHGKLEGHMDEVWMAAFSPDGQMLATASKDHTVRIWSLPQGNTLQVLREHSAPVRHIAWSPNGKSLLTCSLDSRARLWDVAKGQCTRIFLLNGEVTGGVWARDGESVVVISQDGSITRFSRDGRASERQTLPCHDVGMDVDGSIVTLDFMGQIHFLNPNTLEILFTHEVSDPEDPQATCFHVSQRDHHTLLLQELKPSMLSLLGDAPRNRGFDLLTTYSGHQNIRYTLRPCFARSDEGLVVIGSEDGRIVVYDRYGDTPLQRINGHASVVNCVAWTDAHGGLLASASDDQTVALWNLEASATQELQRVHPA